MNSIFTEGLLTNVVIYAAVYLLAEYAIYKIIFNHLVGSPAFTTYQDLQYWARKASFIGAVIFAPLYEEIMFTYLAYTSFLHYAPVSQRGFVVLFVALFFALLHLPGDLRQLGSRNVQLLLKFQVQRFFYSLTAYFIYLETGNLLITITIHYLYNAIVSVYQFEPNEAEATLTLILLMNISFGVLACYFFYLHYPALGLYLVPILALVLFDYLGGLNRLKSRIFT